MNIGDRVMVNNPTHRMYGKIGEIITVGSFIPDSWGVMIEGSPYSLLTTELLAVPEQPALKAMVEKLDKRKRGQTGYTTHLPEVKAILNELTERVPASIIHTNTTGPEGDISVQITIGFTLERDLL